MTQTLDQLSAAASGGTWHHNDGGVTGSPWINTDSWTLENGEYVRGGCILNMVAHDKRQQDAAFIVALVNAYRTGQLVAVQADVATVERIARALCKASGKDPDRITPAPRGVSGMIPLWSLWEGQAKAAIAALAAKGDA